MFHARIFATIAALLVPALASAHDFWLERSGNGFILRYGHRGGELLAMERAKVVRARCLDQGASRDLLGSAVFAAKEVKLTGTCSAASVFYDGGYYSLTPDGEQNRPKNQVPDAVKAWASRQFAKWVDARSPAAAAVLGDELELVPVSSLAKAREGDKVTVRVLHLGKPVANAIVAIDHKPLGETDEAGETRIKLRTSGLETIGATLRQKVSTPEADAVVLEASLSFEVAK